MLSWFIQIFYYSDDDNNNDNDNNKNDVWMWNYCCNNLKIFQKFLGFICMRKFEKFKGGYKRFRMFECIILVEYIRLEF